MVQLPPQAAAMEVDAPNGAASGAAAAPPPPVQAVPAGGSDAAAAPAAVAAGAAAAPASSADTAMTAAQDSHKAEEDGEAAKAESPKSAPRSRGRARVFLATCLTINSLMQAKAKQERPLDAVVVVCSCVKAQCMWQGLSLV